MRECGDCTLCCKLEKIPEIKKPAGKWCDYIHCNGCTIYQKRPKPCVDFQCMWLKEEIASQYRPDILHLYMVGSPDYVKVVVDPLYPDAWKSAEAKLAIESVGRHAIVQVGSQLNFVPNGDPPERLLIDWTL